MSLTASARGRVMNEIARRIREHAPLIAEIESRSAGRPIRDIRGEAVRVAEMFEYYAGWCDKLYGDVIPVPSSHLNYTRHEPIGVVTQITPWNAPLFTGGWQIAPAICAGNGVVIKPSELTPLSTLILGLMCEEGGAPRGLVNVIAGQGPTAGQAAVSHPRTGLVVLLARHRQVQPSQQRPPKMLFPAFSSSVVSLGISYFRTPILSAQLLAHSRQSSAVPGRAAFRAHAC